MKKFLSLVLALVMAMSLVTISAGATEYKDLTDKEEIQYEEAVAVLNKIGIITGYPDGSFKPEDELTRGAAAKIIVSLLIGPEAAGNLTVANAPYTDVAVDSTYAAVINYCKTANIVSGYGDGTFRPGGALTGYAFAKMLLGALGYNSQYEGFVGSGWNMNVAARGADASLFDRVSFKGNENINRETACQLALNTLKGTMVEYSGGMNITSSDGTSMVVNPTRSYKFSNQEYARHILNKKANSANNVADDVYTVEFGEEHFVDLRMNYDRNTNDDFGRPSNEWSYKKITIGTYPIEADYVFTTQTAHKDVTDAVKNRATGLGNLTLKNDSDEYTTFWLNGKEIDLSNDGKWQSGNDFGFAVESAKVADISDLTDNGATVEVYISEDNPNWIRDVVVVKTQLMEVRKLGSDYVALQAYNNGKPENNKDDGLVEGFNQVAINAAVTNVQAENENYALLSGLKEGDIVAVVPVTTDDGKSYEVAEAYVPETVSGELTAVETYSTKLANEKKAVSVSVGGTKYNVAQWSKDLVDIDGDGVKVTRQDVTLYLDKNGNAMLAEGVGSTEDFIIIGSFYRTMVNNRIVTIANGWSISGDPLELNLGTGTNVTNGWNPGDVAYYTDSTSNYADWQLRRASGETSDDSVKTTQKYVVGEVALETDYSIKSSNVQVKVATVGTGVVNAVNKTINSYLYVDKSVKFVYVSYDTNGEVESVEVKSGMQNVTDDELKDRGWSSYAAQVAVSKDTVKAVVIKGESTDALSSNLMYIRERAGGYEKDSDGNIIYKYTVVMMRPDERVDEEVVIYSDDNVKANTFVSYTAKEHDGYSNFYDLRDHSTLVGRTTATYQAELGGMISQNNGLLYIGNYKPVLGDQGSKTLNASDVEVHENTDWGVIQINTWGGVEDIVRITNAEIVDLRWVGKTLPAGEREINSIEDLKWFINEYDKTPNGKPDGYLGGYESNGTTYADTTLQMQLVINDNPNSDYFRDVALIVITDTRTMTQKDDNLNKPASTDASLSNLTVDGMTPSFKKTDTGKFAGTVEFDQGTTKLVFAIEVDPYATVSYKVDSENAQDVDIGSNGKATFSVDNPQDNSTVKITIKAEDQTEYEYTITLKENAGTFTWNGAWNLPEGADDVLNQEIEDINDLKVVITGNDEDLKAQVEAALDHLGYKDISTSVDKNGNVVWTATFDGMSLGGTFRTSQNAGGYVIPNDDDEDVYISADDLSDFLEGITRATLHDTAQSNSVPDNILMPDGYVVEANGDLNGITITMSHPGLYGHANANDRSSWWIGFALPEKLGEWSATISELELVDDSKTSAFDVDGREYTGGTMHYWGALAGRATEVGDDGLDLGDAAVYSGKLTLTKSSDTITIDVTIDASQVHLNKWGSYPSGS